MSLSELTKYKGLDFSLSKNKDLFKQLYAKHLITPNSTEHCLEVFHYLIRKLGIKSEHYIDIKDHLASKTESGTTKPQYFIRDMDMYQLDMFTDWNENNPNSMIQAAINIRITPGQILNFCAKNNLYIGDSRLFDMLDDYASYNDYKKIPYYVFDKLNIEHQELNKKAYTHYQLMKFTDKSTEELTTNEVSILRYMLGYGIDKYDFLPLIRRVSDYSAIDSPKLNMLYLVWREKMKNQEYVTDSLDREILKSLLELKIQKEHTCSIIKLEHLMPMLKQDITKNGYALLSNLSIESLKSFIAEQWAIPYIKTVVGNITFDNETRLRLLRTNAYAGNDGYKPELLKDQFILGIKENRYMMFYNLPLILPVATDIKNIIITPITKSALLLALLTIQSKDVKAKHAKALDKIFPGIMTDPGRLELINHLIPTAKTMLQLNSLYSEIDIISFAANEYNLPATQESLPELCIEHV